MTTLYSRREKYEAFKKDQKRKKEEEISRIDFYNKKYPNINPLPEEDLNIENMVKSILEKAWYDKKRFPLIEQISIITGLSERQIYRLAKQFKFHSRRPNNFPTNK
ncbi:MAG: hypothetical protein ABIP51_16920 [Bacteroidia bacterium]